MSKPPRKGSAQGSKHAVRKSAPAPKSHPLPRILPSPLFKTSRVGISSNPIKRGSASSVRVGSNDLGTYLEVDGHEYISTVSISGTSVAGDILLQRPNTVAIANTRLAQFASIYERWEPIMYQYHFTSSLPATTGGAYVMVNDPDPSNPWTSGVALNIPNAFTMAGSSRGQFWEASTSHLPSERDYTSLWCRPATVDVGDPEDRLSAAGQFLFLCVVPTGTTQVVGFLELEYRIRFYLPRLTNNSSSSVTVKIPFPALFNSPTFPGSSTTTGMIAGMLAFLLRQGTKIDEDRVLRALRDAVNLPHPPPTLTTDKPLNTRITASTNGLPSGSYQISSVVVDSRDTHLDTLPNLQTSGYNSTMNVTTGSGFVGSSANVTNGITTTQQSWDGSGNVVQYYGPDGVNYMAAMYQDYEFYVYDGKVSNGISDIIVDTSGIVPAQYPFLILYLTIGVTGNEHYYNPSVSSTPLKRISRTGIPDIDKQRLIESKQILSPKAPPVSDDDGEPVVVATPLKVHKLATPPSSAKRAGLGYGVNRVS